MEITSTGNVLVGSRAVATYELIRTYEPRIVDVGTGPRTVLRDLGRESQAYVAFPEIYDADLRSRLQTMIDVQVSVEARRSLRDQRADRVVLQLERDDGSAVDASVAPPSLPHRRADHTWFPVSLGA